MARWSGHTKNEYLGKEKSNGEKWINIKVYIRKGGI